MSALLYDPVTKHARRQPDAIAVVEADKRITYAELEQRSNQLARSLAASGCKPGDRVCFPIPKSINAAVAVIGILKAGCIYTPLDVSSPSVRLARIIDSCEPKVLLSTTAHLNVLKDAVADFDQAPVVGVVDSDNVPEWAGAGSFNESEIAAESSDHFSVHANPDSTAYILFTSGSTGVPKGVPISHSNVTSFVDWANGYFDVGTADRLSGHTSLHFDLSVYDLFGAISAGAELHLVPPEASLLPTTTADFIRTSELSQWFSVPSVLNYMYKFDVVKQDDFPALKRILWCGEVLPTPALIYLMERLPHVTFANLYGPTETTIASSYYTVPSIPSSPAEQVPIGVSCGGESLFILDEKLKQVGNGETAELYIGGVGLSTGYWRDDAKTREAFLTAPPELGTDRIYKTGDLAYSGEDGLIHFVGRSDTQIKSRGYRIELGEIGTALNGIQSLIESAVVAVESDGFEGTAICCAYVPSENSEIEPSDISDSLRSLIPDYMVPTKWKRYDRLPKNSSGKIDRVALKKDFESAS